MEIISGKTQFQIPVKTAVAIGKFDGVHLGHRRLIEALMRKKAQGLAAAIFTFDPSPAVFFAPDGYVRELSTKEEKRLLFGSIGIDYLVEFPLTWETASTEPEIFVKKYLASQMNAGHIVAGDDLSFGRGGAGNFVLLDSMSDDLGFTTEEISKVRKNGIVISSSYVRELVEAGRMEEAEEFLGTPYSVLGEIVHGNEIGRTLGIPTLNQVPTANKLLPPFGVYYSDVTFIKSTGDAGNDAFTRYGGTETAGRTFHGMTNIGVKPTIKKELAPGQKPAVTVETY
ncbi:MAG: bifunctional riboflavin kinase/FMN adenylyltransferase, partial [Clostridiales bacterium]|nr:bifunctional riboflavin kinase/FMN adenylyltransferase [Clostridiales bacterium]